MKDIDQQTPAKKTIIYAWNYVEWGGAQIYTLALIREAKKNFNVLIVLPDDSSEELLRFLDEADVRHECFGPQANLGSAPTLWRKIQRHWRKLRSEAALIRYLLKKDLRNSVVHLDLLPQQSFLPVRRLLRRAHVFFTMHNALPLMSSWREMIWRSKLKLLLGTGRFHIFASNENAKNYFHRFVSDDALDAIKITRAGIDSDTINRILETEPRREGILHRLGIPKGKTIVLTVGQFIDRKGRWTLLETIRYITRERDDLQFLWLSPNPPSNADREKIAEFDVGSAFRFITTAEIGSRKDYLNFLRVADIFVLPSFLEGIPISLLEAMALGIASISTEINGIPEAIDSGKTGLLLKPGDSYLLRSAIIQLADNSGFREELAANGRAKVLEKFDENGSARIASEEYRKYLEKIVTK